MPTLEQEPVAAYQPGPLDHELRVRTDTVTWLAETLNGNMRTSFEFSFDGHEIYGEDGGAMTPVFDNAIQSAEIIVQQNPSLWFELRRRIIERGELDDMKAMVRGELLTDDGEPVNTIVVPSDFPPELMDASEDVGGYNSSRKQTMLRIITLEANGMIKVATQSLDGSNRRALEAIYATLGKQPEPGELLPQRINLNIPAEWQPKLIDTLTDAHDDSLHEQFGGEWHGGRRPADYRNTYDFANSQHDLVDLFTAEKLVDPVMAEKLRYKVAATAKARYERFLSQEDEFEAIMLGSISPEALISVEKIVQGQTLHRELEREGHKAAVRGDVFSGCGDTVEAEGESMTVGEQLAQLGLGNKIQTGDDDCEFVSKQCPECGDKDVLTTVRSVTVKGVKKKHITGSCGCDVVK
jgi:hypothetical protein